MARSSAPTPIYTLRPPHAATINHLSFSLPGRLITADADGWITVWKLGDWRVETVWLAHPSANAEKRTKAVGGVLWAEAIGKDPKGREMILSQGRDHRLVLTALPSRPSTTLSRAPIAPSLAKPSEVETLAESPTNALSFCKASCVRRSSDEVWIAAPSAVGEEFIDVFSASFSAASTRIARITRAIGQDAFAEKTGALMALSLCSSPHLDGSGSTDVLLLAGYEDGRIALFRRSLASSPDSKTWTLLWTTVIHREPTLSVAWSKGVSPSKDKTCDSSTSSAWPVGWSVGADHRIGRVDVEPPASSKDKGKKDASDEPMEEIGSREAVADAASPPSSRNISSTVHKTLHPGLASVIVRSDSKILATAGWDGRIRLYDARIGKNLRALGELEVRAGKSEAESGEKGATSDTEGTGVGAVAFAPISASVSRATRKGSDGEDEDNESMEGRALLAASSKGGRVVIWEAFPP